MPSPNKVQLNLSIDLETKESLKQLCDDAGVSLAQSITEYVQLCESKGYLITRTIDSTIPSTNTKFITEEEVENVIANSSFVSNIDRQIKEAVNQLENSLEDRILEKLTA